MDVYSVILAGGNGTRFWPLSRQKSPKHLLNLSGNDIMINETIKRCNGFVKRQNTLIVTSKAQAELLKDTIMDDVPQSNIIVEPDIRNTAPCIALAAMVIKKMLVGGDSDAVMILLPSDHYIENDGKFIEAISLACDIAKLKDNLVTIGIKPTFPSTAYGYIKHNSSLEGYPANSYEVVEFIEKPDHEKARSFLENGGYMWNSGIFVWKVSTILENFNRYLPRIYKAFEGIYDRIGTVEQDAALQEIYQGIQRISVDYGILERSDDIIVIPGEFEWSDLGSWDVLSTIFPTDDNGNVIRAHNVGFDTKNTVIYGGEKLIATIGLDNMIIVDTDDALLVCNKEHAQKVKNLVEILKKNAMNDYL